MNKKKELDRIKEFIDSVYWKFAKTMPESPHEYTLREWAQENGQEEIFDLFILYIRKYGYRRRYERSYYIHYDIDKHSYWTMGAPLKITILINRQELDKR